MFMEKCPARFALSLMTSSLMFQKLGRRGQRNRCSNLLKKGKPSTGVSICSKVQSHEPEKNRDRTGLQPMATGPSVAVHPTWEFYWLRFIQIWHLGEPPQGRLGPVPTGLHNHDRALTTPASTTTFTGLRPLQVYDHEFDTRADSSADADTNDLGLNNNNRANTDSDDHDIDDDALTTTTTRNNTSTTTTTTKTTTATATTTTCPQQRPLTAAPSTTTQAPPQWPQQQYINNHHDDQDDNTLTAARTTH
ncbi:hypothetical protein EDB85DRAFT_1903137 [Lactarius pseudohatsudake]|nr:hypothetical protein EDB85DRAFT_1903137 [Lactarius pseudohatsudake]